MSAWLDINTYSLFSFVTLVFKRKNIKIEKYYLQNIGDILVL